MPRPRSITDKEIKEAAREVFVEYGPAAPVSMVAKRLGVSHAALFNRAGSKDQLMMDALCPERPDAFELLNKAPPTEQIETELVEILADLMQFLQQIIPNLVVLRAAGRTGDELRSPDGPAPPVALRKALGTWLNRAAEQGSIGPVDGAAVAEGLLGAMEARCFNAYLGGEAFAPGDDGEFLQHLVQGLI